MTREEHLDAAAASLGNIFDATGVFADWRNKLLLTDKKKPKPIMANAVTAFRHAPEWKGVLGYDEFGDATTALRPPPWAGDGGEWEPSPWTDADDLCATVAQQLHHEAVLQRRDGDEPLAPRDGQLRKPDLAGLAQRIVVPFLFYFCYTALTPPACSANARLCPLGRPQRERGRRPTRR